MSFFVAVFREVPADRLADVLSTIRGDFAASRRLHPGRRGTRLFQRLNYPTHLLEIAEWDSVAEYEQLRRTPAYQAATVLPDPPARIEYLTRLRLFARMSAPAAVVGCVILTCPPEHVESLIAYILDDVRHGVEAAPGLVTHEVYRMGPGSGRLLVVHSWRTIEDLERFRASVRRQFEARLQELGVSSERLTSVVAAELSRLDA